MERLKKIIFLIIGFFIMINTTVFAIEEPSININVNGEIKKGSKITISINASNVSRLYAASVDYVYDPSVIKVKSIEGSSLIKDSENNKMELGGETDKDGNKASYQMTFTGKVDGITGSGELVKIEAEVLKDFNLVLSESNLKIKLVYISNDYEVTDMSFKYNGFGKEEIEKPSNPGTGSTSGSNSKPEEVENSTSNNEITNSESNSKKDSSGNISNTNKNEPIANNKKEKENLLDKKDGKENSKDEKTTLENNNLGLDNEETSSNEKNMSMIKGNNTNMLLIALVLVVLVSGFYFILKKKKINK